MNRMQKRQLKPHWLQRRRKLMGGEEAGPLATTPGTDVIIIPGGGISSTNVQAAIMELDAEKVAKAGDVMTGFLTLHSAPTADMHAANRKFVTDSITAGGGYTDEQAMDAVAGMIKNGTGITWAYDDTANTLTPTVTGGGGGTPGGATTQVQFNDGGAFNGTTGLIFDKVTNKLTVGGQFALVALAGNSNMSGSAVAGSAVNYIWHRNLVNRWVAQMSNAAESTGNVGSDWALNRYDDAGVLISAPISVARSTGMVTHPNGLTVTGGNIFNSSPTTFALYYADSPAGFNRGLQMRTGTSARWLFYTDNVAESGSNTGSDFGVVRYSDAGANIGTALSINRATGIVNIPSGATTLTQTAGNNTTSVATTAFVTAADSFKVSKAGDTMTGSLVIDAPASAGLTLDKASGGAYILGMTNGSLRWQVDVAAAVSEGGSNSGSDFRLIRYSDAGGALGTALEISRATGVVDFAVAPTVAGAAISASDSTKVLKAGDTMTGPLKLPATGGPSATSLNFGTNGTGIFGDSATFSFSVNAVQRFAMDNTGIYASLPITLSGNPSTSLQAAPKQYVDSRPVGIAFPLQGKPAANAAIHVPMTFPVTVPANLTGAIANFVTAATGAALFRVWKIAAGTGAYTAIGTVTFTAGSRNVVTLAGTGGSIAAGDSIALTAPSSQDTTLADGGITIQVTRT